MYLSLMHGNINWIKIKLQCIQPQPFSSLQVYAVHYPFHITKCIPLTTLTCFGYLYAKVFSFFIKLLYSSQALASWFLLISSFVFNSLRKFSILSLECLSLNVCLLLDVSVLVEADLLNWKKKPQNITINIHCI